MCCKLLWGDLVVAREGLMRTLEENAMAEFAAIDPIYVDGRLDPLVNLGANFATYYFRWIPVQSKTGEVLYKKTPALILIRPLASLDVCHDCKVPRMTVPPVNGNVLTGLN
jgi:hypothetical protein